MAITLDTANGSVVLKELIDGYSKGVNVQAGPWVRKRYLCPWASVNDAANAIMGLSYGVGGIGGTIIRNAPHRCPESENLFCLDVGPIEGFGTPTIDGGRVAFEYGILSVSYGTPTFQLGGSLNTTDPYNLMNFTQEVYPYCTQSIDYDSESYTIEAQWKYAGGSASGKPITGSNQVINVNVATMALTVHRVPYLPAATMFALLKRSNNATFLGQPTGTVMFDRVRTNRVKNTDGTQTLDLELNFRWREVGWNSVPDPADGSTWVPFTHDGTTGGRKAYVLADLKPTIFGVDLS